MVSLFSKASIGFGLLIAAIASPVYADAPAALDFKVVQRSRPARTIPLNAPAVQGNQILLNGQAIAANWSQWQANGKTRIGLSDAALTQLFGVDLLSTNDSTRQPIQWFTQTTLPTRLVPPFRYLDITDFAQQNGWQIQPSGNTLQISTQPANVAAINQALQSATVDRVVIALDRATPWQIEPQQNELVLTLNARIDLTRIQAFKPNPANRIRSLKVEPAANRTIIKVGIPIELRPQITTLSNPDRIVIDVGATALSNKDILWTNGLRWRQQLLSLGSAQFSIVWLEVNPRQPGLTLRPILPSLTTLIGTASLFQTAQQASVSAAINGGYFNRNNQLPLGMIKLENRLFSGPILGRGVVGWDDRGNWRFDRVRLQETIVAAQRFPLTTLNSAYAQAGIARYTSDWGSTYTTLTANEILLTVQNNRVVAQQTAATAGSAIALSANGYLLVFRSNRTAASNFAIGTPIQLESTLTPADFANYPNIIGGGPLLIQNGQIVLNAKSEQFSDAFIQERAIRSAIGQTADGTILIVTIHPASAGGATLSDTAAILRQLGAINALNFDGGSSTTLYLGGQILDRPLKSTARVHNGVGVFFPP